MAYRLRSAALAEFAEGGGGEAEDLLKGAGEVERVAEPQIERHLLDELVVPLEESGGLGHLELGEVLIGALAVEPFEESAQVGFVDVAALGDLLQRAQRREVVADVLAAALVGGEGGAAVRVVDESGFGDLEDQQLDQLGTNGRPLARAGAAGGDQVVEDPQDRIGRGDPDGGARRQAVVA